MKVAAVAVLLAMSAACGGTSAKGSSGSSAPSLAGLAIKLGCGSSLDQDAPADKTMFTSESGSCSFDGQTAYLSTFTGTAARDNYLQAAKQSGGRYVVGDGWIVYSDDDAAADAIKAKIGGTIKS